MKQIINKASYVLIMIVVCVCVGLLLYTALSNPTLTQTQVFLSRWREYIASVVAALLLYWVNSKTQDE